MRTSFLCECKKMKGKLAAVLFTALALLLIWIAYAILHTDNSRIQGFEYTYMTTSLITLNSLFLPTLVSVAASRLMDVENKGNTYKLLCTLQNKPDILNAKLLLAALSFLLFFVLEYGFIFVCGQLAHFTEAFPVRDYTLLFGAAFAASLLLLFFQLFLSLRLENQLYPLFIGLLGSFAAIFSMFLPLDSPFLTLVPWSYFLLGATSQVNYDEAADRIFCAPIAQRPAGWLMLFVFLLLTYALLYRSFLRKDV